MTFKKLDFEKDLLEQREQDLNQIEKFIFILLLFYKK